MTTGLLPRSFATLPSQPLEIRRVPPDIQDGAPNGYYNPATLDGSRPAIYWINLKSTHDWPKYSLPSLTYHEGVPGHHLQISLAQASKDIPMLRKISFFNAYLEGWALYSEQLSTKSAAIRGSSGPAICRSSCSARRAWSSIPVSTPRAGAAKRRSTIWSRPPVSRAPGSSARSSVTALDRPGLQLQGRPSRLAPCPRQRQEDPWPQVRHQGLPRRVEGRRHAADHPPAPRSTPRPRQPFSGRRRRTKPPWTAASS